jgi:pilus assembly protein Flp/PilA
VARETGLKPVAAFRFGDAGKAAIAVPAFAGSIAMTNIFNRFIADENGATAIEYGLIAALIAVVVIGTLTTIGTNLDTKFGAVATALR